MKRYLVFKGHQYYAKGGWNDFIASYDTLPEASKRAEEDETYEMHGGELGKLGYDWVQIVDLQLGKTIYEKYT